MTRKISPRTGRRKQPRLRATPMPRIAAALLALAIGAMGVGLSCAQRPDSGSTATTRVAKTPVAPLNAHKPQAAAAPAKASEASSEPEPEPVREPEPELNGPETSIEIDGAELSGMSGFRAHWDQPIALEADGELTITDGELKDRGGTANWKDNRSAIAFDALNRSILMRFPDAAERIAEKVAQGQVVTKAEIVLPFRDEELWPVGNSDYIGPLGYEVRKNWDVDKLYRKERPTWHAVAWALRRPWKADPATGPTFNANVNGSSYWTRYGAGDTEHDRYPAQLGPAEVSYKNPDGLLDVTSVITKREFGPTLAQRLRQFADCGVMVRKWETYDHRYYTGAYEWATATGGRAIVIGKPRLHVTFRNGHTKLAALPPPVDIATLRGGSATAVIPSDAELAELAQKHAAKPAWMNETQWAHVQDLYRAEHADTADQPYWYQFVPEFILDRLSKYEWKDGAKVYTQRPIPREAYEAWVDGLVGRQPRGWSGFESAREMSQWYLYGATLPGPAQDAIKRYWIAWLMPDRDTIDGDRRRLYDDTSGMLVHPMVDDPRVGVSKDGKKAEWNQGDTYVKLTGDWRGNKSFFRSGFTYDMSTQNFNTTASAGALLAGALIGSDKAMADGRHGVETFLQRMWAWADGSGQEHIDHYYFSHTMVGNKVIADFSQTPYDRLVGQGLLAKNVEELSGAYHPGLRGFIAGSSRTGLDLVVSMQDGLYFILHTISADGTLRDYGVKKLPGDIAPFGHDAPAHEVARLTLAGPWAPDWVRQMIDDKPLPFEAKHRGWGGVTRTAYLGRHYGVATTSKEMRIQVMAQWKRSERTATSMKDLGTLDLRHGIDETRWQNDGQGRITPFGSTSPLQHENKVVALMAPSKDVDGNAKSLQASIGLFNFEEPAPSWKIYVDGSLQGELPITCRQGQRITIHDGTTYLGIIPLEATDLGRDAEVVIQKGNPQKPAHYGSNWGAAVEIDSYYYKSDKPISSIGKERIAQASGGFVFELADVEEFPTFKAFQRHFASAKLDQKVANGRLAVTYASGPDRLEAEREIAKGPELSKALVNGASPYLGEGVERDTPYCQQGLGSVKKGGAVLSGDPRRRLMLTREPKGRVTCGWNPLPDLSRFSLTTPNGIQVVADGTVSVTRLTIHEATALVEIDSAFQPGQDDLPGTAKSFVVFGAARPRMIVNGREVAPLKVTVEGRAGFAVPIAEGQTVLPTDASRGAGNVLRYLEAVGKHDIASTLIQDWYVVGAFPSTRDGAGFDTVFPPEQGVDLKAVYAGAGTKGNDLKWSRMKLDGDKKLGATFLEFGGKFDGVWEDAVAYAYTQIESDRDRTVTLYSGSDDTITIWVNGEKVLAKKVFRGTTMDDDETPGVKLAKGANAILVKVCQGMGGWGMCLRVADEAGIPLTEGVRYGF